MATLYPPTTRAAATVLAYILGGFGIHRPIDGAAYQPLPGLPDAVHVPGQDALVVVVEEPAPHGRVAIQIAATERRLDVVLVRIAHDQDGAVAVSIDLTLAALPHAPWSLDYFSLWSGADGDVWLVPAGFGPAVEVTVDGLMLDLTPPYTTGAERALGILRAGAEIACLMVKKAR